MEAMAMLMAIQIGAIIVTRLIADPKTDTLELETRIAETESKEEVEQVIADIGVAAIRQLFANDKSTSFLVDNLIDTVNPDEVQNVVSVAADDRNLDPNILESGSGYLGYIIKNITKNMVKAELLDGVGKNMVEDNPAPVPPKFKVGLYQMHQVNTETDKRELIAQGQIMSQGHMETWEDQVTRNRQLPVGCAWSVIGEDNDLYFTKGVNSLPEPLQVGIPGAEAAGQGSVGAGSSE